MFLFSFVFCYSRKLSVYYRGYYPESLEMDLSSQLSTRLETIKIQIKNSQYSNLKTYLMVAIPVIILIIYIVFKYRINPRTLDSIANINYKTTIKLANLPICANLDKSMQYKLCDYYISSSSMTPCIGNQHYDYVSLDMLAEVIQSGARYIQLPICESDVSPNALPVVGTAQYGQRLVTSLNTLDIRAAINVIRSNAFNIDNKKINYPIFIHLILNTTNPYTLGILADTIREVVADKLCDVTKYTSFPIFLEKLCNLLGQMVFFATPEYAGTKLEQYIVPTHILFESYYYGYLAALTHPSGSAYSSTYNNKLSTKQQTHSNKVFKAKYPSLDYIISNFSSNSSKSSNSKSGDTKSATGNIGKTILADKDILNNLTNFNKVGMTLVKPQQPADVLSNNYDPTEAVYNGCQFIAMNFQTNDDNMRNYIKIFKEGGFVLKPASMRFSETEEPIQDLQQLYKAILPTDSRVDNSIYYNFNNVLIALESYSMPGYYLTQVESNLRFNLGGSLTLDKFGNKTYNISINQCFLLKKSTVSMGTADVPMFLVSPNYQNGNMMISQAGNTFDLEEQKELKSDLYLQSYVFEKADIKDADDLTLYLVRTINLQNPMYIANQNKIPKTYAYNTSTEAKNNMAFKIHIIPFHIQIKFFTLYDGSMKTMAGGIVGILQNNTVDGTSYIIESTTTNPASAPATSRFPVPSYNPGTSGGANNFNYLRDPFYLRNPKTNSYLACDTTTGFIYDNKPSRPGSNGVFNLTDKNGFYSLRNSAGQVMILYQENILKFIPETEVTSNENLFKINVNYVLA